MADSQQVFSSITTWAAAACLGLAASGAAAQQRGVTHGLEARYLEFDFTLNPAAFDKISGHGDEQFCRQQAILTMEIASLRPAPINKERQRKVVVAGHTFDFTFQLGTPDPLGRLRCQFKANCRGPRHGMGVSSTRSLEVGVPTIITTSRSSSSTQRSVRMVLVKLVKLRPPLEEL